MTMRKQANKKNLTSLLKRVLGIMLREYKVQFGLVVVLILGAALATLRGTLFMRDLVDVYIKPMIGMESPDFGPLAHALLALALVYLIGLLCSYGYNRIMAIISQGTLKKIRIQLFSKMESLPIKYFDTTPHGDIMSVYTNDVDTLRQLIGQSIPQLVNSTVTIVITFISMVCLNIPLTVLTLCMVAVMLAAASGLGGAAGTYFIKQQRSLGKVNAYIEEMMEGQKAVKVFCHERENIDAFRKINQELRESTKSANQIANILMPVNANLGNISYVLCAVLGAVLALNGMGSLTLGTLVSYLNLNRNFTQPVTQVSQQLNSIIMALAGAERIFQLLDEQPEPDGGHVQLVNAKKRPDGSLMIVGVRTGLWAWRQPHSDGTVTLAELKGGIVFDDVDFGYSDEKIVLHHIKLFAEPGQKIAFVGSTGVGKTTITNLINRFYDIQDGKIRYDGININKIKKADLRRSLGIVLQDTHLFTGTVMENIRYGRLDATDEECVAAAKLANADGFIRRLPDGYQTVLTGDSANLSQGQRQLIAIARAAVAGPPVLILDEATSSIDTRTERLVQEGWTGS